MTPISGSFFFNLITAKRAQMQNIVPEITLCDVNQDMLNVARNKAIDSNMLHGLQYVCADAEELPFPDNSFDYYTIAFGIRNVPKIDVALKEAYRVLKPMGKFLCLEFSKVDNSCLQGLYDFYSFNVIPKIGGIIAGDSESYKYLVESIRTFPVQTEFLKMMEEAGFKVNKFQNLTNGIVALYTGYKV